MSTETSTPTRKADESGTLSFDGSNISYTSRYYGTFFIPLREVAVIGEVTNQDGPGIDDWFLLFVLRSGGGWFEASMYAEGSDCFREQLSVVLGVSMHGSLYASTDFASRIIWPVALADRPLFNFSSVTDFCLLRRLKLFMLPEVSQNLSSDVLSAIERTAS